MELPQHWCLSNELDAVPNINVQARKTGVFKTTQNEDIERTPSRVRQQLDIHRTPPTRDQMQTWLEETAPLLRNIKWLDIQIGMPLYEIKPIIIEENIQTPTPFP